MWKNIKLQIEVANTIARIIQYVLYYNILFFITKEINHRNFDKPAGVQKEILAKNPRIKFSCGSVGSKKSAELNVINILLST